MCVSTGPASFTGTTVILGLAFHPEKGKTVHVLVYENTPVNLQPSGGNALVLHFPARPMSPENVVSTEQTPNIARDCREAVQPRMRGGPALLSFDGAAKGVHVFESGIYTVVLAQNPRDIPAALERVPAHKRPALNPELFAWYAEFRPGWPMAVCCFDNRRAAQAKPMMWWYEPLDATIGLLPAIDAHDGRPPRLNQRVDVDHWAIFGMNLNTPGVMTGSQASTARRLTQVEYTDRLTELQEALLPTHVMGRHFTGSHANADFLAPVNAIAEGNVDGITRGLLSA